MLSGGTTWTQQVWRTKAWGRLKRHLYVPTGGFPEVKSEKKTNRKYYVKRIFISF